MNEMLRENLYAKYGFAVSYEHITAEQLRT